MKFGRLIGAFALLCTAVICCTGCSDLPEDSDTNTYEPETTEAYVMMTLSNDDISSITDAVSDLGADSAVEQDPSEGNVPPEGMESPFGTGVYLGRATDWTERFFFFTSDAGGNCFAQENSAEEPFTVTMDGKEKAVFHIGESTDSAELFWIDDKTVLALWESGVSETLTKVAEDPAGFRFYSSEALSNKALDVFTQKNGYRPALTDVILNADDTISIKLYDEVDGHTATCDWYVVDRYTGIGTNMLGDPVDLSDGNNPPHQNTTEASQPVTETQPATETAETQPTT